MTVLGLVLAAGAGTRFGPTAKLAAPFRAAGAPGATTVIGAAVAAAVAAALDEVAVVVGPAGAGSGLDPVALVEALPADLAAAVTVVVNPGPGDGLASSLRVGVDHARARGHAAVVVGLGDQPLLDPRAWRAVADAVAGGPSSLVFATYDGRRGHPVGLAAAVWADLPATGDEGARTVAQLKPQAVGEVPCPGNPADIDTAADLARWTRDRPHAEEGAPWS
ncbi:MAG: NTP transferase domain-containing protein [Acidimicrobiales bacterium]